MNPTDPQNQPHLALETRPSLWRRLAATAYDTLLLLGVLFIATAVILPLNAGKAFNASQYCYPLYLLLVSFGFFGWFWTHGGQTLGLKAWKIKVQTFDGHNLNWGQAARRFCFLLLTLGIDLIWLLINKRYLAIHERLSGSTVFSAVAKPG